MKKVFYICFGVFVLSGCTEPTQINNQPERSPPMKFVAKYDFTKVAKICDEGRAVYIVTGESSNEVGAIAVIPNAKECNDD